MNETTTRRGASAAIHTATKDRSNGQTVDCLQAEGPAHLVAGLLDALEDAGCRWRERWGVAGLWARRWDCEAAIRVDVVGPVGTVLREFREKNPGGVLEVNHWPGLGDFV